MKRLLITLSFALTALFAVSCGKQITNIQIPGVTGPTVTLQAENIVIDMAFEKILLDGTFHYAIPQLENSYVDLTPAPTTNAAGLKFIVNIASLLKGYANGVDPLKLPGGRPLPGVTSGQLPAMAFTVEKFQNMTFYIGKDVFGFFVPVNLGMQGSIASFRYYIGDKRGGNISLVGQDPEGLNAGILLLLDMNAQAKKGLNRYLRSLE